MMLELMGSQTFKGIGVLRVEPSVNKTRGCKLQPNRRSNATTWQIQTSDSAFAQLLFFLQILLAVFIKRCANLRLRGLQVLS